MGEVYIAKDATGAERAIKIVDLPTAAHVERFNREAQVVRHLEQDCIAEIYQFGIEDGVGFIVMELVDGFSIARLLEMTSKTPADDPAQWVIEALEMKAPDTKPTRSPKA